MTASVVFKLSSATSRITSYNVCYTKLLRMMQFGLIIAGLAMLVFGSDLLVESASDIARSLNISELVIGLTIVAIGTSLPELAASIAASLKKEVDIAVGNVVGSNIFNLLSRITSYNVCYTKLLR